MKIKHLFLLFAATTFALTGCNKDDNGGNQPEDGEFDFYLKITREDNGKTRADAGQVADGKTVEFTDGGLFFADATGKFVRYVRITNDLATGTVTAEQLEDGHLFKGISNTATKVYIVGNHDFSGKTAYKDIDELNTIKLTLKDQADANFGVANATLYGASDLVPVTPSAANEYANREAKVKVRPLIARWEIAEVGTKPASLIDDGWVLEGIYIDNFYYTSSLLADYSDWNENQWINKLDTYDKYARTSPGVYTNISWNPILFDDGSYNYTSNTVIPSYTGGLQTAASNKVAPAKGAWAYNMYADAGRVPNIVLCLSNVKISGTLYDNKTLREGGVTLSDGIAYLTVTGYNQAGSSVSIEGGHVYILRNLLFDEDDLRNEPKGPKDPDNPDPDKKFDVWVEVELMDWKVVPVEAEFN